MHTLWLLDRPSGLPFERANANSSAASAELLHDELHELHLQMCMGSKAAVLNP